jgi:putative transposase
MTKIATGGHPDLKMVNPAAAAIDIGSTMHMAAVNPDTSDTPVRAFGTFTQDLHDLADWFEACGVTSVAMESTGVYWIPAFEVQRGHDALRKVLHSGNQGADNALAVLAADFDQHGRCKFTSIDWAAFLRAHNLEHSMSRRGNCHDNAVAESFFNLLKRERIRRRTYRTREEARQDVFDYIEMFYNPKRKHASNGMLSPVEFERRQKMRHGGV